MLIAMACLCALCPISGVHFLLSPTYPSLTDAYGVHLIHTPSSSPPLPPSPIMLIHFTFLLQYMPHTMQNPSSLPPPPLSPSQSAACSIRDRESELERRRAETASLRETADQLQRQVDEQGVSVEAAQELMRQRSRLEDVLAGVRSDAQRVKEAADGKEVEASRVMADVEALAGRFNSMGTR